MTSGKDTVFSADVLRLDCEAETLRITSFLRDTVGKRLRKRGAVVAVSGGIDSSVVADLCVRALGKDRVFALLMPDRDSSAETPGLSKRVVQSLGIEFHYQDITPILEELGCYRARDEAIRAVIPEYTQACKCKIVMNSILEAQSYRYFSVMVEFPDGRVEKKRLPPREYLGIVAAMNFKQRTRKMLEYYHADRLNCAVAGTSNRLETDQGFFVKLGDGAGDVKPIAHLYKTQVYQMGERLGIPAEIRRRPPSPDTYSMEQSHEEFYFSVPYHVVDLCMYGLDNAIPAEDIACATGLTVDQIHMVFQDIRRKRLATEYLRRPPAVVEPGQ